MADQLPAARSETAEERMYLLERVAEAAVVQLYADGFRDLSLHEKILTWHLYNAAIAGRDIFYDQRYAHNLAMRDVLETLVRCPEAIDPDTYELIHRYTKLFWINTGPYNNLTARKFTLPCAPEAFADAVRAVQRTGVPIPHRPGETLDQTLRRLESLFFDADVDPAVTCKTPSNGRDILQASANNLYSNVTVPDLAL